MNSNATAFCSRVMDILKYQSKVLYDSAYDSISYSSAFIAAAIAANFFFSIAAAPLAITAGTIYFANVSINLLQESKQSWAITLKEKCFTLIDTFQKRWPYAHHVILIAALAVSLFSLIGSLPLIFSYAFITAVIISINKNKENNKVDPMTPENLYSYPYLY